MKHIDEEGNTPSSRAAYRFQAHRRASTVTCIRASSESYTRQLRNAQQEASRQLGFYVRLEDLSAFEEHQDAGITAALSERTQQPFGRLHFHGQYILGTLIPQLRAMTTHEHHVPAHD